MNSLSRKGAWMASFLFVAGLLQQACIGECNDCGPCGFAGGPNLEDALIAQTAGADADGTPTLEIARIAEGECGTEGSTTFWIHMDAGAVVVESAPTGETLNAEVATRTTTNGVALYTFSTPAGFSISSELLEDDTLDITFDDGTTKVIASCAMSGEDGMTCTAQ